MNDKQEILRLYLMDGYGYDRDPRNPIQGVFHPVFLSRYIRDNGSHSLLAALAGLTAQVVHAEAMVNASKSYEMQRRGRYGSPFQPSPDSPYWHPENADVLLQRALSESKESEKSTELLNSIKSEKSITRADLFNTNELIKSISLSDSTESILSSESNLLIESEDSSILLDSDESKESTERFRQLLHKELSEKIESIDSDKSIESFKSITSIKSTE